MLCVPRGPFPGEAFGGGFLGIDVLLEDAFRILE
jgi:hypothetical protein